jgi:hypothetical protein
MVTSKALADGEDKENDQRSHMLEEENPDYIFKGDAQIFKRAEGRTSRCTEGVSSNMEPIGKSFRDNTHTTYKQNDISKTERDLEEHEPSSMLRPPG